MTRETRIADLLGEWFERQESGEPLDPEALIEAHPELADDLRAHFTLIEVAGGLADGAAPADQIPERLGGFRIEDELGAGGMGRVFRAVGADDATVAIKLVHPHLFRSPGFFKRFLREADLGRRVDHENVVRTLDVDAVEIDGKHHHFLVMEYVEGQTLRELLDDLERAPEELCRLIATDICQALSAIHAAGAVHRDLKPENVLITPDQHVKVMDLGVAQLQDEALKLSQTGVFVGSIHYAAPEQFTGGKDGIDARADLHGLGLLLYELAAGRHPYGEGDYASVMRKILDDEPRRLGDLNPQLSPFFEEVVHRLLAKKPDERFSTADELLSVLGEGEESTWWHDRAREIRAVTQRPLRRIRVPRETAVYGREQELAQMKEKFEQAKAGNGQVLLIEGEAGIGKTRLVDEFVSRLRQDGEDLNFLFGSYPPMGASAAHGALSTAFSAYFGQAGSGPYLPERPALVASFDALLRGDPPPPGEIQLSRDALATVFVEATRNLSREHPTVLLLDDLHFAPQDARELFLSMALAAPSSRLLLVGTARPTLPEEWRAGLLTMDAVGTAALSRLSGKDLADLLVDAFQSKRLAEELAFKLLGKSDGNPFFVFEIIQGLREGQFLSQRPDGSWHTTRVIEDIEIPSSILDLVNARVADLPQTERNILDVASCQGFAFDPTLVADVLGSGRIEVLQILAHVERKHRLVRSTGREFAFDHHQVQEALYGGLPDLLREEYHAGSADALARRTNAEDQEPSGLDGDLCVALCDHYLRGGRGTKALRYLDAALTHLAGGHLHGQVADLAECALGVSGLLTGTARIEVLLRLAGSEGPLRQLARPERFKEAALEAERLAELAGDESLRQRSARAVGRMFQDLGQLQAAHAAFSRSLEWARRRGDQEGEAGALVNLGIECELLGRMDEAWSLYQRGLALCEAQGYTLFAAIARANMADVEQARGRLDEAVSLYESSLEYYRSLGDLQREGLVLAALALALLNGSRPWEAKPTLEESLRLARVTGDRVSEGWRMLGLGICADSVEDLARSEEWHEAAYSIMRETGSKRGQCMVLGSLANVLAHASRISEALHCFEESLNLSREIGDVASEATDRVNLGAFWLLLGNRENAREQLILAEATGREIRLQRPLGYALCSLGMLAAEEGDDALATARVEESVRVHREIGHARGLAESLLELGELEGRRGNPAAAQSPLQEAADLFRAHGRGGPLTRALANLACLPGGQVESVLRALAEDRQGRDSPRVQYLLWQATDERDYLCEAKRKLDAQLSEAPEEHRASLRDNVRLNREIMEAWEKYGQSGEAALRDA